VTPYVKIGLIYGAWLVICGLAAWCLARWSARRRVHGLVFALLVLIMLLDLAQVGYVLVFGESIITRDRNPFERFLQHSEIATNALLVLWPFATAIGVAQASLKIADRPVLARWISFGCSVGVAALTPVTIVYVWCGLAGMCID
jgi:phosphopantothenate synthetase